MMRNMETPFDFQYWESGDEVVSDIMDGVRVALTTAYKGTILMTEPVPMGHGLASDGMIVKLDTIKNIARQDIQVYFRPPVIPLSEIQFQTPRGIPMVIISLWIPAAEVPYIPLGISLSDEDSE